MDSYAPYGLEIGDLHNITTYQAGVMQSAAHRALQKYCDDILQPYGLTKIQWLLIGTVLDNGDSGIRPTDLANQLGTTSSWLATALKPLVARKVIRREQHSKDSRSKLIFIHPDFAPDCAEIERAVRDGLRRTIYAHITPLEFRIYLKVLYQLSQIK